jgi:hypothetical protein
MKWVKLYDETSGSHYYWNQETDETQWDEPCDTTKDTKDNTSDIINDKAESSQDKQDNQGSQDKQDKQDKQDNDYYNSKEYHDWYYNTYLPHLQTKDSVEQQLESQYQDYTMQAYFNTKTKKFTANLPRNDPRVHFSENTKAERQMDIYFDVERYKQERGMQQETDKLLKPTKKQIEAFKKKKAFKKQQKNIAKYAD